MQYPSNLRASAHRHLLAGDALIEHVPGRRDVAGYIYGWAAESAFKAMMSAAGIPVGPDRRSDPYYAHFEDLKQMFLDSPYSRRATTLRKFAEKSAFMQRWHTSMRYSDGKGIDSRWIDQWANDAKDIVGAMDS